MLSGALPGQGAALHRELLLCRPRANPERLSLLEAHLRTRATENAMALLSVNGCSGYQTAPTAFFDANGRALAARPCTGGPARAGLSPDGSGLWASGPHGEFRLLHLPARKAALRLFFKHDLCLHIDLACANSYNNIEAMCMRFPSDSGESFFRPYNHTMAHLFKEVSLSWARK